MIVFFGDNWNLVYVHAVSQQTFACVPRSHSCNVVSDGSSNTTTTTTHNNKDNGTTNSSNSTTNNSIIINNNEILGNVTRREEYWDCTRVRVRCQRRLYHDEFDCCVHAAGNMKWMAEENNQTSDKQKISYLTTSMQNWKGKREEDLARANNHRNTCKWMKFGLKKWSSSSWMENMDNKMKILDRRMQNYIFISINSFALAWRWISQAHIIMHILCLTLHSQPKSSVNNCAQETDLNFAHLPTIIIKRRRGIRKIHIYLMRIIPSIWHLCLAKCR